jgi:hypothetical protein
VTIPPKDVVATTAYPVAVIIPAVLTTEEIID